MCLVSEIARQESFAYTYDADGNETQEVETVGPSTSTTKQTINYTYNADGMLYSETGVATDPQGVSIGSTTQNGPSTTATMRMATG